jgi:chorismate mutase/prephenate dehydrogenase
LRDRIRAIDRELIALAAERVRIARRIGAAKRADGLPTVDYAQERRVIDAAHERARGQGLDPSVAEDLVLRLIRASVGAQEADSLRHAAHGVGRRAVIVGGAGRMGRWMDDFLASQGWEVAVIDPAASDDANRRGQAWLDACDLVVLSTPPGQTSCLYRQWLARPEGPPRGVLVDLASIKTPLVEPIRALLAAGVPVASIHPMFGPSTVLLRDAEVVICDVGEGERAAEATALAQDLFAPTTARVVPLPLEQHDRVMADLLSLSHATAIAFALALPEAEHPVGSTTFQALERLAGAVVRESPDVYYEIQADNPHSVGSLERLCDAVTRLREVVEAREAGKFADLLEEGRRRASG